MTWKTQSEKQKGQMDGSNIWEELVCSNLIIQSNLLMTWDQKESKLSMSGADVPSWTFSHHLLVEPTVTGNGGRGRAEGGHFSKLVATRQVPTSTQHGTRWWRWSRGMGGVGLGVRFFSTPCGFLYVLLAVYSQFAVDTGITCWF